MDVDQAARSNAQEYFGVKDPDYYEFEGKARLVFSVFSLILHLSNFICIACKTFFQHMYSSMTVWKKTKIKKNNATDL